MREIRWGFELKQFWRLDIFLALRNAFSMWLKYLQCVMIMMIFFVCASYFCYSCEQLCDLTLISLGDINLCNPISLSRIYRALNLFIEALKRRCIIAACIRIPLHDFHQLVQQYCTFSLSCIHVSRACSLYNQKWSLLWALTCAMAFHQKGRDHCGIMCKVFFAGRCFIHPVSLLWEEKDFLQIFIVLLYLSCYYII